MIIELSGPVKDNNPVISSPVGAGKVREDVAAPREKRPDARHGEKVSQEEFDKALEKIQKTVLIFNRNMHFEKDEKSGRIVVKVMDSQTNEVIREIPPKEIVEMQSRISDMIGLLVDKRA